MKRLGLIIGIFLFVFSSFLYSFSISFGNGKSYEGIFKPYIYNYSATGYFDNGEKITIDIPKIFFELKIISKNFDPYKAKVFAKINNSIVVNLSLAESLYNVYPGYLNTYDYAAGIYPNIFNLQVNYDGYVEMLNKINSVTFVFEYDNDTYQYTISNFQKYKEFLKDFNHTITSLDTSQYPILKWNESIHLPEYGFVLHVGDKNNWDNSSLPSFRKIDSNAKRKFAGWFNLENSEENEFNISQVKNLIIPKGYYIARIKTFIRFSTEESNEGNNIGRLQGVFKKVPISIVAPITTVTGWKLLGCGSNDIFIDQIGNYFNIKKINTVWSWENNTWSIWSPSANLIQIIKKYNINILRVIYHNHGFWINFK